MTRAEGVPGPRGDSADDDRGRGPRAAEEIFAATLRLLAERGYDGLTIEGVAEAAGVNKTTIYRWWPSKAALLGAAIIRARMLDFVLPDTGSLRGDLVEVVRQALDLLTGERTRLVAVAAFAAAARDEYLARLARRFFAERLDQEMPIFQRAVDRGEIDAAADRRLVMDLLAGAIWLRVVFRQEPVEPDFAERVVGTVLTGVPRPGAAAPGGA